MGIKVNFDTLYTNGDSWTAGHFIQPSLIKKGIEDPNHIDNTAYRKKYSWPAYTGFKLGIKVENKAHAGASNDWIVRSTINDFNELLKTHSPNKFFALIGWSSPERKDFFYKNGEIQGWDTFYPAEYRDWTDKDDKVRNDFYKSYVVRFWNEEEYYTRHMLNVINLSNFFKTKKIKFRFFDSFYESKANAMSIQPTLYNTPVLGTAIGKWYESTPHIDNLNIHGVYEDYSKLYSKYYIKQSFLGYLKSYAKNQKHFERLVGYHPSKEGHIQWAEHLISLFE